MIMADQNLYSLPRPKPWYKKWWGFFIILTLAIAIIFMTAVAIQVIHDLKLSPQTINQTTTVDVTTTDDLTLGRAEASITIVEFGDFNCPYCKQSFAIIKQLLREFPNDINFIYRDFPVLSQSSFSYALAVECAQEQGSPFGWAMHDLFFINQGLVPDDFAVSYPQKLNLNLSQFNTCFSENKYLDEIRTDIVEGRQAGAVATPTFFINGHKVSGHQSIDSWRAAIKYLLEN